MNSESVSRVGSNQRVCWERLEGELRTAERRVGNGDPKPYTLTLSPKPKP